MRIRKAKKFYLIVVLVFCIAAFFPASTALRPILAYQGHIYFEADMAWSNLEKFAEYAPVLPNTSSSEAFLVYSKNIFQDLNWTVTIQNWTHPNGAKLHNLIASSPTVTDQLILLGAHFDARINADQDPIPSNRGSPVPGINDGGSGVAILLELARVLELRNNIGVWIVLFDAEDQGGIPGWYGGISGWCIGSSHFVNSLNASMIEKLKLAVILDIVGGKDLVLRKEASSTQFYVDKIWSCADYLGFAGVFLNQRGSSVIDDHLPFLNRGIPAVDIIQQASLDGYTFFKWWHTTNDTLENCEKSSLYSVGRTLELFIENIDSSSLIMPSDNLLIISAVSVSIITGVILVAVKLRPKKTN